MDTTCAYCHLEKSPHAQMCPWCYDKGAWMDDDTTVEPLAPAFKTLLANLFSMAKLKPKYVDVLLTHEAEFERAFTARSHDIDENYEVDELLGDGIAGSFISWYFYRRFPQTDCADGVKVLARLKINFGSKRTFSGIAEKLGFWPHIRASEEDKIQNRESLLEDVFEAFCGCATKVLDDEFDIGVGYGIVYRILQAIFDDIKVSLEYEDLYDAKTRLKELFDANPQLGQLRYEDDRHRVLLWRIPPNGKRTVIAEGEGRLKGDREQAAATKALENLAKEGISRSVRYNLLCEA